MKSKAQQYIDWKKQVGPKRPSFGITFYVSDNGDLYFSSSTISQEKALQLRDWLTDTFDTPKIPGSKQPGWSRED